MQSFQFFSWSFPLMRLMGTSVRVSWTLLVVMVFGLVQYWEAGHLWMIPFAVALPLVVMLAHAFGHIGVARLIGGRVDVTTLWALGDISALSLPLHAGKQFAVAIAGPLVSMVLWMASELLLHSYPLGFIGEIAYLSATLNFWVMAVNLVPSSLFDGGRIWRALLWPMLGRGRAARTVNYLAFLSAALLIVYAVKQTSFNLLVFGLFMFFAALTEYRALQMGEDPVLESDFSFSNRPDKPSWFSRWRARRRQLRLEAIEREEAAEQDILDRLLAKVSEQGLPSLSGAERRTLHDISKKQKDRLQTRDFA